MQIEKSGFAGSASAEVLRQLRTDFAQQHYLKVPQLLSPDLLDFVQSQVEEAEFYERVHEGIGSNKELCMAQNTVFAALQFLVNDQKFFEFVQAATQCEQIGCFQGRVYRVSSSDGHHDSWHDDLGEDRLLGMSINLSKEVYAGGVLQLRDRASGTIVSEVSNAGRGDALIFRLSSGLQHRITQVAGRATKTAFAGWFRAQPDFVSLLKKRAAANSEVSSVKYSALDAGSAVQTNLLH
jgi:hypothetical protein